MCNIPPEVMKMKRPHVVPLSTKVVDLFTSMRRITGAYPLVFIGRNKYRKPISKESMNQVIELLGYKGRLTGHGFRHTMSTILHEQGYNSAWIETQLAHVDKNSIPAALTTTLSILMDDARCCSGMPTIWITLSVVVMWRMASLGFVLRFG